MKVLKNTLAVAAAFAMVGAPVIASAAPASKLSVSQSARVSTAARKDASQLQGGSVFIALLAAVAVIAGIVVASGGSNGPKSP